MLASMNDYKHATWTKRIWPELTEFGPPACQAEADTELTLSSLPARAVSQIFLKYGIMNSVIRFQKIDKSFDHFVFFWFDI